MGSVFMAKSISGQLASSIFYTKVLCLPQQLNRTICKYAFLLAPATKELSTLQVSVAPPTKTEQPVTTTTTAAAAGQKL